MVKYDDYVWHYKGEFPIDLHPQRAATHIGVYFCWCVNNNLISEVVLNKHDKELQDIKKKRLTGAQFLLYHYHGKLTNTLLNQTGNAFTRDYYEEEGDFSKHITDYFHDYQQNYNLGHGQDIYHVLDTWENYYLMEDVLDHRYKQWKNFVKL
ncbi:DUF7832 domain-containing protein [Myroides sp. LJL119]